MSATKQVMALVEEATPREKESNRMSGININRRTFVQGGVAASALAALAACGKKSDGGGTDAEGGEGAATASSGGVLKYFITNPVAIDPYNAQETQGMQVTQALFDSLTGFDWTTGDLVPKAAESWDVSDDAKVFTFHLVKDAKFHNGDPVDAASFKRGWERICDPTMTTPSVIAYHLNPIKGAVAMQEGKATEIEGVKVIDDLTLEVTLDEPMAEFPYICTHDALAPVPQAALDDPDAFALAPIGNGPFKMEGTWVADQYIDLVRFDDYYAGPAKIDEIYFSIQKDPNTAFREFEAGNLDFTDIPAGRIQELEDKYGTSEDGYTVTPGKQVLKGQEAGVYWLVVNVEDEVLKDLTLRQAISLAINRQNIVDTVFEGTRQPATSVFPTPIDSDPSDAWEFCKYDKDAAAKLLDEKYPADSKGKRGIKLTLSYNSGGGHEDIMSCIQGDLEAVGIECEQSSMEWAAYLSAMGDGSLQIGRMGWNADFPIMDNFIYPNFLTTSENNYSKYSNPDLDKGLEEARKILDEDERKAAYRELNAMIAQDMPVIPLMYYAHNFVGSERLANLYHNPQTKTDFETVEFA